jgi:hypothetical protein
LRNFDRNGLCSKPSGNASGTRRGIYFVTLQEHNTNLFFERDPMMEFGWRPVVNATNSIFAMGHRGALGQDCTGVRHTLPSGRPDLNRTCLHEFQAILESCLVPGNSTGNVVWMTGVATQELTGTSFDWNDPGTVSRDYFTREQLGKYSANIPGASAIPLLDLLSVTRPAAFASNDGSHYYIPGTFKPNSVAVTVSQIMARAVCHIAEKMADPR